MFTYDNTIDTREILIEDIQREWNRSTKDYRTLSKLQKELRLLDGCSDKEAKGYYRQLERYLNEQSVKDLEEA